MVQQTEAEVMSEWCNNLSHGCATLLAQGREKASGRHRNQAPPLLAAGGHPAGAPLRWRVVWTTAVALIKRLLAA